MAISDMLDEDFIFSIHFKTEIFKTNKFIDQSQKEESGSNKSVNSNKL